MTIEPHDGGPAFPVHGNVPGMSLRDWYAGMALQGLIIGCEQFDEVTDDISAASKAFKIADAMLAARTRHQPAAWESFCDPAYYDLWAVRPFGDQSFTSQRLFHVQSKGEAEALRDMLNGAGVVA